VTRRHDHASLGEAVDTAADYLTIFILAVIPIVLIHTQFDLIGLHNERLANRVGLHWRWAAASSRRRRPDRRP
jgi:hypothetical protein